jgi:hypothetical protein
MNKKLINTLTKEEFDKEFEEGMTKIPEEQKIPKDHFLFVLLQRGILNPQKYFEFLMN